MSPIKGYLDRLRFSAPVSTTTSTCWLCVNKSRGFSAVYAQKGHPSLARVVQRCLRRGRNHFPERLLPSATPRAAGSLSIWASPPEFNVLTLSLKATFDRYMVISYSGFYLHFPSG